MADRTLRDGPKLPRAWAAFRLAATRKSLWPQRHSPRVTPAHQPKQRGGVGAGASRIVLCACEAERRVLAVSRSSASFKVGTDEGAMRASGTARRVVQSLRSDRCPRRAVLRRRPADKGATFHQDALSPTSCRTLHSRSSPRRSSTYSPLRDRASPFRETCWQDPQTSWDGNSRARQCVRAGEIQPARRVAPPTARSPDIAILHGR